MNGAQSLIQTLTGGGLEVCFANPGTTEMPLVSALDDVGGVRSVLGLFEGVCTGAADGYARMTGRPAATLLHLGPGFANGLANLHNARRGRVPLLNLVGDQATYHRSYDAPLTSDIASFAAPVSGWVRSAASSAGLARDGADALAAACDDGGHVATLIVPSDCQWDPAPVPAAGNGPVAVTRRAAADEPVETVAKLAAGRETGVLLLGGPALSERGLRAAGKVAAATGWRLVCETFPVRLERGGGLPAPEKLPYFPEDAVESLTGNAHLVLAGASSPVAFFAYPDVASSLVPDGTTEHVLAGPREDAAEALERLAGLLNGGDRAGQGAAPDRPSGPLDVESAGAALAALQPEGAIIVDEGITSGFSYFPKAGSAPRHSYLGLTGGAIGWGPPIATGAAVACPDRPVIAFQADGSAMYTLQALWTQARESLDVTTLICSNRTYRVLQVELARAGDTEPGPAATALTDLAQPALDWVALGSGLGVPSSRATTADELLAQLDRCLAEPGPHLVEMVL